MSFSETKNDNFHPMGEGVKGTVTVRFTCEQGHDHVVELPMNTCVIGVVTHEANNKDDFKVMMCGSPGDSVKISAGINHAIKSAIVPSLLADILKDDNAPAGVKKIVEEIVKVIKTPPGTTVNDLTDSLHVNQKEDPIMGILNELLRKPKDVS